MIKIEDNAFECLNVNSKFKICWGLTYLTTLDPMLRCFSIECYSNFHLHIIRYLTLISRDE